MRPKIIVVNGFGHCGTTYVAKFISRFYPRGRRLVNMNDLNTWNIKKNASFHTHTPYPAQNHPNYDLKVIYIFGDIYNSVLGYGHSKMREKGIINPFAAEFLHIPKSDLNKNIFDHDVFNFKQHFKNWNQKHTFPLLSLRYETIYSHLNELLTFAEIPKQFWVGFPAYKKRKTDWSKEPKDVQERLRKTYGTSFNYIKRQPDSKQW